MIHYIYDNFNFTFADGILCGVYFEPGGILFGKFNELTVMQVKPVLERYGIIINRETSIAKNMKKQTDGSFFTTVELIEWDSNLGGITHKIKYIELQEKAFKLVYNDELFELLNNALSNS